MFSDRFERLRSIGMTPATWLHLQPALNALDDLPEAAGTDPTEPRLMRLVEVHREAVRLHDGIRESPGRVLPRLARSLAADGTALAVGDWVLAPHDPHGQAWVQTRLPPLTHLARRDADGRRHPVVSNVDTALLVMGLDADFNLRRLERYFALLHGSGVLPVVVLSKADTVAGARIGEACDAVRARAPSGVDVQCVDATAAVSARGLSPYLGAGQTLVLLGSSGAGKSTLTNTLAGSALQDTGVVREHDSRGKHTTTSRSLHRLPGGACVIDTPGLRALRPDSDEDTVAASFGDIGALAMQCRFRDCRHHDEPGCAVRAGVAPDRLRNFHKLMREARRDTMTLLERQQQLSEWKARGRAGAERARAKRSGA